jgi:nickel/cobalt transporter (NicO) family protein
MSVMSLLNLIMTTSLTAHREALLRQISVCLLALMLAAGVSLLLLWAFSMSSTVPARHPFGIGLGEAAPSGSGLFSSLVALQGQFYRAMQKSVTALRETGAILPLMGIGFSYGVFHAAGPGHGKAIISAYVTAQGSDLKAAIAFSFAAALFQALVAIVLVTLLAALLNLSGRFLTQAVSYTEITGFALIALFGLALTWRKAGVLINNAPSCGPGCGHGSVPELNTDVRLAIIAAAGARPCTGAILLLILALSQQVYVAGILAVLAMGLGVALTTSLIAALAVLAKRLALWLAAGTASRSFHASRILELFAAALLSVLGIILLMGWAGSESIV